MEGSEATYLRHLAVELVLSFLDEAYATQSQQSIR
jgi:hypothetical protein